MNEKQELWERRPGESLVWFRRFERFRLMEPVRSLVATFQEEQGEENGGKRRKEPPGSWYEMAKQWQWEERAAAWDAHLDEQIEKNILAERKKVLRSRYALQHKRIETLDSVAQKLIDYLEDEENIWLPDVKAVGGVRVDIIRFNAPLLGEIRDYLADIAAEKGERVKAPPEGSGSIVQPKFYINISPDEEGSEP